MNTDFSIDPKICAMGRRCGALPSPGGGRSSSLMSTRAEAPSGRAGRRKHRSGQADRSVGRVLVVDDEPLQLGPPSACSGARLSRGMCRQRRKARRCSAPEHSTSFSAHRDAGMSGLELLKAVSRIRRRGHLVTRAGRRYGNQGAGARGTPLLDETPRRPVPRRDRRTRRANAPYREIVTCPVPECPGTGTASQ
jgi:hypothetical protein